MGRSCCESSCGPSSLPMPIALSENPGMNENRRFCFSWEVWEPETLPDLFLPIAWENERRDERFESTDGRPCPSSPPGME